MWAGPTQLTRPDSTPKGLGQSRPNSFTLLRVWAGPGPDIRAGPELAWPRKQNGGGDYFPPPILLHAGGSYATKLSKSGGARRGTWRGGGSDLPVRLLRWRFCGGGRWRCHGSRTTAQSSGAAVSSGGERDSCSSLLLRFLTLLRLLFLFFLFLFMCVFFNSCSSSCFGIVLLPYLSQSLSFISHSPSPLFPASPFSFGPFPFRSFLSLLSVPSFFLSLPRACWRWVVFIGQRERGRLYCRPIAAHGEQGFVAMPRRRVGWPVGAAGRARLPRSLIMRVRGASGLAEHAGREMGMEN